MNVDYRSTLLPKLTAIVTQKNSSKGDTPTQNTT